MREFQPLLDAAAGRPVRLAARGLDGARGGAVTAIPRFGGAVHLTVHVHSPVLDGVYTRPTPTGGRRGSRRRIRSPPTFFLG